ncbi:MAG: hypothetical protein KDA89_24010, partial [Planctomycetaceae bacterium]|nr:hypothetical protein [Planctomycetaceae bacterium]
GDVTMDAGGSITLIGIIDTSGFDNAGGSANSDGGNVTLTAMTGTLSVSEIDSSGGDVGATPADVGGNAGVITLDSNAAVSPRVFLNENITAAGGNNVNAAPNPATRGNGSDLVFNDPVQIGNAATGQADADILVTTTGNVSGSVVFGSTLNGAVDRGNEVVIAAGSHNASPTSTFGNVTFGGAVGAVTRLGDLTVDSANNLTAASTIDAASFTQLFGSGNTTLNGDVTANSGAATSVHRFDGATAVNAGTDQITIPGHGYQTGDNVVYDDGAGGTDTGLNPLISGEQPVGGLTAGRTYAVIVDDAGTIRLALSQEDAVAGRAIDLAVGAGADHTLAKVGISVTANGTVDVNGNLLAENGTTAAEADLATATGEQISVSGAVVDIAQDVSTAAVGPVPSTIYTATGDRILISGTTAVIFAAGTELITDAGLANTFEPDLPVAPIGADPTVQKFFVGDDIFFLVKYDVQLGETGEINQQVHIDWRDPSNDGIPVATAGTFNTPTSDRYQTFVVDAGGTVLTIGHLYSNLNDFIPFQNDNQPIFFADFSLSQHDSIRVLSGADIDTPSADIIQHSSDDPNTGAFNPLASSSLPPADANFVTPGTLDTAADNTDLH